MKRKQTESERRFKALTSWRLRQSCDFVFDNTEHSFKSNIIAPSVNDVVGALNQQLSVLL